MGAIDLRGEQEPSKNEYVEDPEAAQITLTATGVQRGHRPGDIRGTSEEPAASAPIGAVSLIWALLREPIAPADTVTVRQFAEEFSNRSVRLVSFASLWTDAVWTLPVTWMALPSPTSS